MKTLTHSLFALIMVALSVSVYAETSVSNARPSSAGNGGDFGLGLMLGAPSGITAKVWTSSTTAIDVGFAYYFDNYLALLSDYLWHFPDTIDSNREFVPYVGVGGIMFIRGDSFNNGSRNGNRPRFFTDSDNSIALGVRVPLGIEFLPKKVPLGIFAEIAPGIGIIPGTYGFIGGEIGARYYF